MTPYLLPSKFCPMEIEGTGAAKVGNHWEAKNRNTACRRLLRKRFFITATDLIIGFSADFVNLNQRARAAGDARNANFSQKKSKVTFNFKMDDGLPC